eukprot:12450.XXX_643405_643515_1 [CDS] Oithona nana genome sequencing.
MVFAHNHCSCREPFQQTFIGECEAGSRDVSSPSGLL